MVAATAKPVPSAARWDGRQVLFNVQDADRTFPCAISLSALQDLSEFRRFKPADLLKCFEATRPRIEAIALGKLRARSADPTGLLHIWSDDLTDLPAASPPAAAG
jgi:hypothetical protein